MCVLQAPSSVLLSEGHWLETAHEQALAGAQNNADVKSSIQSGYQLSEPVVQPEALSVKLAQCQRQKLISCLACLLTSWVALGNLLSFSVTFSAKWSHLLTRQKVDPEPEAV